MTLFVCGSETCGLKFVYASKHTQTTTTQKMLDENQPVTIATVLPMVETEVETRHCPFCDSKDFKEYVEPKALEPDITNVRSMPIDAHAATDKLLSEGYRVHELYAKTVTLVKKEQKET